MSQIAKSKRENSELCCLMILTVKTPKISLHLYSVYKCV